ncbi:riboflavin synthase alpha chain [Balneicella halophila]|uniref:Riboflavin synthase n=1 Tax=Balneicella halophila TaxID=1537566 RepID=A0A7L4UP48_BALHA|nr:riboflavin synthase [Balneicella halophila]PVX50047.1 riboflavin synthase alpha chain [Balneicella halophila]
MFTGIIEEIGVIQSISRGTKSSRLTISANKVLHDLKYGDSVATDGVCLTVATIDGNTFTADVMAQTLRNSTLGDLTIGSRVNLERALQLSTRLGGHLVSGHIDCKAKITNIRHEDIARWVTVEVPQETMRYLIEKGSVAVDGISLTVATLEEQTFSVSTIPVTQEDTTLSKKKEGDWVNVEMDVLAKYTERLLGFKEKETTSSKVDMKFLSENGFL